MQDLLQKLFDLKMKKQNAETALQLGMIEYHKYYQIIDMVNEEVSKLCAHRISHSKRLE